MKKINKKTIIAAFFVLNVIIWANYFIVTKKSSVIVFMGGETFAAEVAMKSADMQKGLGERKDLCGNCAMLFRFQKAGKYSFWMKDMRFPLDFVWVSEGKIVHIEKNVPADSKNVFTSPVEADTIIEINAGTADRLGLKVGDEISEKMP